jgi:hypothetical protein
MLRCQFLPVLKFTVLLHLIILPSGSSKCYANQEEVAMQVVNYYYACLYKAQNSRVTKIKKNQATGN